MGNTFFDNALKKVKINYDEIIKQQQMKSEKKCQYFLEKEDRICGEVFRPKSKFNRYCPKCNMFINETNKYNYIRYNRKYKKRGVRHGRNES